MLENAFPFLFSNTDAIKKKTPTTTKKNPPKKNLKEHKAYRNYLIFLNYTNDHRVSPITTDFRHVKVKNCRNYSNYRKQSWETGNVLAVQVSHGTEFVKTKFMKSTLKWTMLNANHFFLKTFNSRHSSTKCRAEEFLYCNLLQLKPLFRGPMNSCVADSMLFPPSMYQLFKIKYIEKFENSLKSSCAPMKFSSCCYVTGLIKEALGFKVMITAAF